MRVRADPLELAARSPPDRNAPPGAAGSAFSVPGLPVLPGFPSPRLFPPSSTSYSPSLAVGAKSLPPRPVCAHKEKKPKKIQGPLLSRFKPAVPGKSPAAAIGSWRPRRRPGTAGRASGHRAGWLPAASPGQVRALCGPAPAAPRAPRRFGFNSNNQQASPPPPQQLPQPCGLASRGFPPHLHPARLGILHADAAVLPGALLRERVGGLAVTAARPTFPTVDADLGSKKKRLGQAVSVV